MKRLQLLNLGDSYTCGEGVPIPYNFPNQLVQILRKTTLFKEQGVTFAPPEIIAITGYTTNELIELIETTQLLPTYDFVTLLIGVNNQYRERTIESFEPEFETLLLKAIALANNDAHKVLVMSIPDWSVTPFAHDINKDKVTAAIDAYNRSCEKIALKHHVAYQDNTTVQRTDGHKPEYLALDRLHPSELEYKRWAEKAAPMILNALKS